MKSYRTIIEPIASEHRIGYESPILFMGSCFTENIGNKMLELKFPALVNPFGVLYNPASVRSSLEVLLDTRDFNENDLLYHNNRWLSFYHDTEFSDENKDECLKKINTSVNQARKQLQNASYLIITFGTAWVYQYKETGKVVSNCHKIPAKEFERVKLGVEDVFVQWAKLLNRVEDLNPDLKIIFTVSPVRHWKDGAVQNQLSKSTLILAINQLKKIFDNVEYFPAYEIMMDDLRDYRFYADDMLHPSSVAVDYIWEHFSKTYFENETNIIANEVKQIVQAQNHRPFNPESKDYIKFVDQLESKKKDLNKRFPFINFNSQ
jgi:hypothetical protein